MIAKRFERPQAGRREIEVSAGSGRRPEGFLDADRRAARRPVNHLDADQTQVPARRRSGGARRRHRIEERQRNRRAEPFQDSPS